MNKKETGKIGENIANEYLLSKGYLILSRNHRERSDEIDIVARHPTGTLIFCEVKSGAYFSPSGNASYIFTPEDNLSSAKLKKLIRGARLFLARYPYLIDEDRGWQIDLITVLLEAEKRIATVRHYKNI